MAVIKTAVLETKQGDEFPPRQTPFKYPGIMGKMHVCMFEKGVYFFTTHQRSNLGFYSADDKTDTA